MYRDSFFNKPDSNSIDILNNWKKIGADYLFLNRSYINDIPALYSDDYQLIVSKSFIGSIFLLTC